MECEACKNVVERPDLVHVIRKCEKCGREMRIHEPGEHGIGVRTQAGDQFVIPKGLLKFSFNPLKSSGHFYRPGLEWFAKLVFLGKLPKTKDGIFQEIERLEKCSTSLLKKSDLLKGMDLDNPEHSDKIFETLKANRSSPEWWALLSGTFLAIVEDAIKNGDVEQAVWAMACAERSRSMLVFKQEIEEVVWMGHSAKRVVDVLGKWDANKLNDDEEFWQITFNSAPYVLSQVFAVPVVFIKDKAYVGGMNIEGKDARFVDFLLSAESSREAVLIEIKTPVKHLLGRRYRGVYKPSAELSGAVVQVLDYKTQLVENLKG